MNYLTIGIIAVIIIVGITGFYIYQRNSATNVAPCYKPCPDGSKVLCGNSCPAQPQTTSTTQTSSTTQTTSVTATTQTTLVVTGGVLSQSDLTSGGDGNDLNVVSSQNPIEAPS